MSDLSPQTTASNVRLYKLFNTVIYGVRQICLYTILVPILQNLSILACGSIAPAVSLRSLKIMRKIMPTVLQAIYAQ